MFQAGDIVCYLEAFPLALQEEGNSSYVSTAGPQSCAARMQLKGRFGVLVKKLARHWKVAQIYTFHEKGLEGTVPEFAWGEYVGLKHPSWRSYYNPSPNKKPLEVSYTACAMDKQAHVHLCPAKVSLSNHIMIAGHISGDSLRRLKKLIARVDG